MSTSTLSSITLLLLHDYNFSFSLTFNIFIITILVVLVSLVFFLKWCFQRGWSNFEINTAEIGIGSQKISLKPNVKDKEIAYKIWVELSTRKIGLPIDLEHDVVSEVYDSWHSFFSITRELIKDIPVSKLKSNSTRKIVNLSVDVLNKGLRPHLTKWQARFRHWYDTEIDKANGDFDPQSIQEKYPRFDELKEDLIKVNSHLIKYREKMEELVQDSPIQKKRD